VSDRNGIPKNVTIESAREWVRPRVSQHRFNHVEGVAEVAGELADKAGCDKFMAELAGWLHDACKETKDKQLVVEAKEFGIKLLPVEEANGHLLHGPVAAKTVERDLGITNQLVLHAISEHTLGAVDMTIMSQVLFLADCLEASRDDSFTAPIWTALGYEVHHQKSKKRKFVGPLDLDAAILVACDLSLAYLLEDKKTIHPKTVDVRNWYLNKIKTRNR